jgi:hypothetical protein
MKTKMMLSVSTALLTLTSAAFAQDAGVIRTESGFDILPSLSTTLQHDNNVARSNSNEVSSWVNLLTPTLKANLANGADNYTFTGALTNGKFFSSEADNFTDGYLQADAQISPSSRDNFKLSANSRWLHEERGTGITQGTGAAQTEVVKFTDQSLDAEYKYGATNTPGQVRVNTRLYNKDYSNFRTTTQYRDYDSVLFGAGFLYQLPSAFKALSEVNSADIIYKLTDPTGSRDSRDTNYRLGMEWAFTTVSVGALKLGYQDKNFDAATREDFGGFAWEASLIWQPLTYTAVDFAAGRRAKDVDSVNAAGDFIIETSAAVGWNHTWSETWSTKLSAQYLDNEYNVQNRTDTSRVVTAEVSHQLLRWVKVSAFASLEDRNSSLVAIEYDRKVVGLTAAFTL